MPLPLLHPSYLLLRLPRTLNLSVTLSLPLTLKLYKILAAAVCHSSPELLDLANLSISVASKTVGKPQGPISPESQWHLDLQGRTRSIEV